MERHLTWGTRGQIAFTVLIGVVSFVVVRALMPAPIKPFFDYDTGRDDGRNAPRMRAA